MERKRLKILLKVKKAGDNLVEDVIQNGISISDERPKVNEDTKDSLPDENNGEIKDNARIPDKNVVPVAATSIPDEEMSEEVFTNDKSEAYNNYDKNLRKRILVIGNGDTSNSSEMTVM